MNVSIFHAENDPADTALARELTMRISAFATVRAASIDDLAAASTESRWKLALVLGVPIFLISRAVIDDPQRRKALIEGNPILGSPKFRSYYVCRGIDVTAVQTEELLPLTQEVMIVDETAVDDVIEDLREYAVSDVARPGCRAGLVGIARIAGALAASLLNLVDWALKFLFFAGLVGAALLVVSLWAQALAPYRALFLVLCGCGWGMAVTWVPALDLWPWFGRALRIDGDAPVAASARNAYRATLIAGRLSQAGHALLFTIPWLLTRHLLPAHWPTWFALGFAIGIAREVNARWLTRRALHDLAEERGLTTGLMAEQKAAAESFYVAPLPIELLGLPDEERALFTAAELEIIRRWRSVEVVGVPASTRPFLPLKDYVFISYVWADDEAVRTAARLSDRLTGLGIEHFLDRRHLGNGYVGWRAISARELQRATHVIIVASPRWVSGVYAKREIGTVIQHQHAVQLPSILCVADDDVAAALMRNVDAPLELRYVIGCCARLRSSDVASSDTVRTAIVQRRRQGRVRDWLTLVGLRVPLISS